MAGKLLSVKEASQLVVSSTNVGKPVQVALSDALGGVLAQDLKTPHDSPRFDKSMMDGFAICCQASSGAESHSPEVVRMHDFKVIETVTAGQTPTRSIGPGMATRIMTGAEVPTGADCVVPIEQTVFDEADPTTVSIPDAAIKTESCIVRRGGIVEKGANLLGTGTAIYPQQIAAMAEFGFTNVPVYRAPTVAVLATGNELVEIDQEPTRSQIRNSNAPMLVAQIKQAHAIPVPLGIARDTIRDLASRINQGLKSDILLLTGGVSAGMLDLVPEQLAEAGVRKVFHGVQMKPGKPLWFGVYEGESHRCMVFGLPGNPVSSLVCFELFVRIAINRLIGRTHSSPPCFRAVLAEPITTTGNRPVYHPAKVRLMPTGLLVKPVSWSGSSDLHATVEANAMVLLQPDPGTYQSGDEVDVYLWGDSVLQVN